VRDGHQYSSVFPAPFTGMLLSIGVGDGTLWGVWGPDSGTTWKTEFIA
jgi:hypothetical protein